MCGDRQATVGKARGSPEKLVSALPSSLLYNGELEREMTCRPIICELGRISFWFPDFDLVIEFLIGR